MATSKDTKSPPDPSETAFSSSEKVAGQRQPTETAAKPSRSFLDFFPTWVSSNLRSKHSWKLMLRCCIATWISFVIILPTASLNALGGAAFFALLASIFLPPTFPVQLFFFVISTLIIGLLLGWGIGAAAMRAGMAARDPARLQAALVQLQASLASEYADNPTLGQTVAIFSGVFLDIRSTVVFGVFLAFGAGFFALIRAYAPKLQIMAIFGVIGVDVFCSYGPLFPAARYTLLNSFLISTACYMGIAIVCTVLIFPETMNHSHLSSICEQLDRVRTLLTVQDEVLQASPADVVKGSPLYTKIVGTRAELIAAQQALSGGSAFLPLEFSWGKWNSDDVKDLEEPLVALVTRVAGLQSFGRLVGDSHTLFTKYTSDDPSSPEPTSDNAKTKNSESLLPTVAVTPPSNDTFLIRKIFETRENIESAHGVRITDMLSILDASTQELRRAAIAGVDATKASLEHINRNRWGKRKAALDASTTEGLDTAVVRLQAALEEFKLTSRLQLLEPYKKLIHGAMTRVEQDALPLRSLYISYVFTSNLIATVEGVLGVMEMTRETNAKRKRNRLWAPKGLRAIGKIVGTKRTQGDVDGTFGEEPKPIEETMQDDETYKRDPDSSPPTNALQKTMNSLHSLYQWTKTAEAVFVFKNMFVTIALWIPAVVTRTANFYYVEKGFWALVMAQTTLNIYAADQMFNLVTRLIGTFVGLCFGLLAWYIGNGNGVGNPYGAAAAFGVIAIPLVFIRIFSPPYYMAGIVLTGVTTALIVGYSWIDGHAVAYGQPGIGWSIAWKRFTLVTIGSAASFIMMMLPPTSSRKAVRHRNASSINALSRLYSMLISTWISGNSPLGAAEENEKVPPKGDAWLKEFRKRLIGIAEELQVIRGLTSQAKWEGSIRGKWPAAQYTRLVDVQSEMISSLAQLGGALGTLDDEWRVTFLHSTRVLNPNFIADVMSIFSLVSQSLRTGEPMHQVLPNTLIVQLFYHHRNQGSSTSGTATPMPSVNVDQVSSLEYMYYATGVVAVYQLLQSLDELHKITKELCGEVPLKGFASWRNEYERARAE